MIKIQDGLSVVEINANGFAVGLNAALAAETSAAAAEAKVTAQRVYDSIADLKAETSITHGEQAIVKSYYGDGGNGGGLLTYDATSTETADDGRVFSATSPLIGRFNRKKGDKFYASEHGIVDSSSIDQHAKIQAWAVAFINEGWTGCWDVLNGDCNGGELWFNKSGTSASYESGTKLALEGHISRHARILNAFTTFGQTYIDVGTNDPRYTIDRGPTSRATIRDMHFEGITRFMNLEGSAGIRNNSFFSETGNTSFYDAAPSGWGQNIAGVLDPDGAAVSTVAYTTDNFTDNVEVINCNHLYWQNNNIQLGSSITNSLGNELGAMRMAGCVNPRIVSGRMVSSRRCLTLEAHDVYGGSNNQNVKVLSLHPENITGTAFHIRHVQGFELNSYGPPDTAWAGTEPFIKIENATLLALDVRIDAYTGGIGNGTYLEVDNVNGLEVSGFIEDFTNGVIINDGTNIGKIDPLFTNVTNEVYIAKGVTPAVRSDVPSQHSAVATARNLKSICDNFAGYGLSPMWREFIGTGGATVSAQPSKDGWQVNTPGGSPSDMTQGYKLATAPAFRRSEGSISFEAAYLSSSSGTTVFVGLSDSPDDDVLPAAIGSGNVITASASNDDFAGFLYDRNATDDFIYCITRRNGGTATAFQTTLTTNSSTSTALRIEIAADGVTKFYADNVLLTTVSNAVGENADLAMVLGGYTKTTGAQTVTYRRASAEQVVGS